jgi:hypothetical protein
MALLKRMGLFGSDLRGVEITRATTVEDLTRAYRLVHDVYVAQGYIHPDETGIRIRPYEALPNTATFIAKAGKEVVGVTTVVVDSPEFGLPTENAFKAEVNSLRSGDRTICEGTNWLVADSYRNSPVITELMRCSFAHALAMGYTDYLGTVSPGHGKFYKLLGFEQLGDVRSYSRDIEDPVVLVRLDIKVFRERIDEIEAGGEGVDSFIKSYYVENNPYHRYVSTWQILSDRLFSDATLLHVLFVRESSFLRRCGPRELKVIGERWGKQVLKCVVAGEGTAVASK